MSSGERRSEGDSGEDWEFRRREIDSNSWRRHKLVDETPRLECGGKYDWGQFELVRNLSFHMWTNCLLIPSTVETRMDQIEQLSKQLGACFFFSFFFFALAYLVYDSTTDNFRRCQTHFHLPLIMKNDFKRYKKLLFLCRRRSETSNKYLRVKIKPDVCESWRSSTF